MKEENPRVLVTGGAGFIGSHLVEGCLKRSWKVIVLDNLSTGKIENLKEATGVSAIPGLLPGSLHRLGENAEFLHGDISNWETCRKACAGVHYVFHLAALGSVQRSVEDPLLSHQANATGTLHILQAAREAGVKRLVYASSSSVYGNVSFDPEEVVPKEENVPPHPESPYAATKLAGEIYGQIFATLYGLETVSLRFFNVFGPRQDPRSIYSAVIPRFIEALLKGESPVIYGDGNQSRDFTYVDNIIQANLLAVEKPGISGGVFNIACGGQITVNDLLNRLQEIAGKRVAPRYEPPRAGEVRHSLSSIRLAQERLGFQVNTGVQEGLTATWKWFQKNGI